MTDPQRTILEEYTQTVVEYLVGRDPAVLERADELRSKAGTSGLGALELVRVHHEAAITVLLRPQCSDPGEAPADAVTVFCTTCPAWYTTPADGPLTAKTILKSLGGAPQPRPAPSEFAQARIALSNIRETLERETERAAHALHDEAGQLLAVVHLKLAEAASQVAPQCQPCFTEIQVLLVAIEEQLRRLSQQLSPTVLDDFGLLAALQSLAENFSERTGLAIGVESSTNDSFPPPVEAAVYRAVQEALHNVHLHAGASRITVSLALDSHLRVSIRDDGAGFDVADVLTRKGDLGLGLIGIRERLEGLGGTLSIFSVPGKGTELSIAIPTANPMKGVAEASLNGAARAGKG